MAAVVWDDIHVDLLQSPKSEREIVQQQVAAAKIMERDDQIMICNLGDIIYKYRQWVQLMPRVKPFYAVKCNNDDAVLQVLADCGASFDCASKDEIQKVLSLGVAPSRIIYAHTVKQPSMLKYAAKRGVTVMTFDNETELFKIKTLYPDAKLVLRTTPAGDFKSKIDLRYKFGCPLSEVRSLLQTAKDLGLDVIGVSFHVGSGCHHADAYADSIRQSRGVFDMAAELGFKLKLLDIGGGYPGESNSEEIFKTIARTVNEQLEKDFPSYENVEIIAEPGTYMTASSSILAVNVIGRRKFCSQDLCNEVKRLLRPGTASTTAPTNNKENTNIRINPLVAGTGNRQGGETLVDETLEDGTKPGTPHVMYYVNDGVYGSFQDLLVVPENLNMGVQTLTCTKDKVCFESTVWGPTCCGFDCIIKSTQLPMMEVGDWIYFRDMGAYTIVFSGGFNGMSPPRRVYYCLRDTWRTVYPTTQIEECAPSANITNGFH